MLLENLSIPGKPSWRLPGAGMISLLLLAGHGVAAGDSYRDRGGGPDHAGMLTRGDGGLPGMAFVRPVLAGVLYRAGFRGGDKDRSGLSGEQRDALCEAGFSGARYVDFGTRTSYGTLSCGAGSLDYGKVSSSDTGALMQDIHSVIKDPEKGPILVHCMWGVHSSGAVSAMALVQFCGWSEDQAKKYWNEARNNAPCSGGCDEWIGAKFKHFRSDPALEISAAEQRAICPQPGG